MAGGRARGCAYRIVCGRFRARRAATAPAQCSGRECDPRAGARTGAAGRACVRVWRVRVGVWSRREDVVVCSEEVKECKQGSSGPKPSR